MDRRKFLKSLFLLFVAELTVKDAFKGVGAEEGSKNYDPRKHDYGMGIEVDKCIGCGNCLEACKIENDVPREPFFVRTWVERYTIASDGNVIVKDIRESIGESRGAIVEKNILRSFFVPKLCNQCKNPPCVQVCPVAATFTTDDGVILVDEERCIGCRYCIHACPYGARFLHPVTRVAEKCTFCYHRIVRGLLPACVEVCPTQARLFGNLKSPASPLIRFKHMHKIHVLKRYLNTEPKVFYSDLDGEVT